jgi:hypothetical protein
VLFGIVIYVLFVFLLPAFIFKRLRRREWTYLAVILGAGLATLGIYRWGLLSGLDGPELEEVTILRIHGDGKAAEATTFVGLISPGYRTIGDLPGAPEGEHPLSNVLPQPLRGEIQVGYRSSRPIPVSGTTLVVDPALHLRLPRLTLKPNGMRCLRYDYRAPVDHLIQVSGNRVKGGNCAIWGRRLQDLKVMNLKDPRQLNMGFWRVAPRFNAFFSSSSVNDEHLRTVLVNLGAALCFPGEDLALRGNNELKNRMLHQLRRERPGYLIGLSREPFFPGFPDMERRKSMVVFLVELEPDDGE